MAGNRAWLSALVTSTVAWSLPGIGFWLLAGGSTGPMGLPEAEYAYAVSAGLGGLTGAPGGVLVAGSRLLDALTSDGMAPAEAAFTVLAIRLATVGVATVLGAVFLLVHIRSSRPVEELHFDAIADAYDVQIPESRREALLGRKTQLMRETLEQIGIGRRGLDVGCGQGAYVLRMRELGFDVAGIDASAAQVAFAARKFAASGVIASGSVLQIPAANAAYDFVYIINVLHHLSSVEEQRQAFSELLRVLVPGGLLFVHEINTRNLLFRFYMGYVFPSLNCIDEGVERWLLPHKLRVYTDADVIDVRYFTFLPEFVPQVLIRLLTPLERLLEASPLGGYSAHYMAVIRKKDR
jgi:ubiquinone/menaquinone biosynthesis C-methylase UbiE